MWDISSARALRDLARQFSYPSACSVLVYDVTDAASFEGLEQWRSSVLECVSVCVCVWLLWSGVRVTLFVLAKECEPPPTCCVRVECKSER